jgi:sodium-dependent dicarboxylate transporter 2/3/5
LQYHGIPNWRYWPLISLWTNKHLSAEEELEKAKEEKVGQMLKSEYKKLGRMSLHEAGVLFVFLVTIILWFTRDPRFMPGWDEEIEGAENGDATAAMIGVLLMFIIPRDLSFLSPSKVYRLAHLPLDNN